MIIPNAYWVTFLVTVLVGFAIPEGLAIKNKVPGDTLSERTRAWLRTDTPGGGWTFLGVWSSLLLVLLWFLPHILRWF